MKLSDFDIHYDEVADVLYLDLKNSDECEDVIWLTDDVIIGIGIDTKNITGIRVLTPNKNIIKELR